MEICISLRKGLVQWLSPFLYLRVERTFKNKKKVCIRKLRRNKGRIKNFSIHEDTNCNRSNLCCVLCLFWNQRARAPFKYDEALFHGNLDENPATRKGLEKGIAAPDDARNFRKAGRLRHTGAQPCSRCCSRPAFQYILYSWWQYGDLCREVCQNYQWGEVVPLPHVQSELSHF